MANQLLHDVVPHTVDFLYITELLRAETHNLPGFETAMKEQVSQSLLLSSKRRQGSSVPGQGDCEGHNLFNKLPLKMSGK
jgi:hypothetical protein